MSKKLKMLSIVLILLIGIVGLSSSVSADSDLYTIEHILVGGVTVYPGDSFPEVELDNKVLVEVKIQGANESVFDANGVESIDVKMKAWIGGYEYDDISETTGTFDIEPGVTYKKNLWLEIPEDLDVEEDHKYTLYVEVYDDEEEVRESVSMYAERPRHSLNVFDIIYDRSVNAGEVMNVEVRLENLGELKEEDIKVSAFLGDNFDVEYMNELASLEIDNEDEESSESINLFLNLDEDMTSGYYDLVVTMVYNRGHDEIVETFVVWVDGKAQASVEEDKAETSVSLSSTSLKGAAGADGSFTLTFANTGTVAETYTIAVNGIAQWATSDVSPSVVILSPGEVETVEVTVTPKDDASGDYSFTVNVLDSTSKLVQEVPMTMDVEASGSSGVNLFGDSASVLKIAFIILIVLIVLIGLIVAFRKLNDDDDDEDFDPLEPKDGQTYY